MPSLSSVVAAGSTLVDALSQVETNYKTTQNNEASTPSTDILSLDLESRPTKKRNGRPRSDDVSMPATDYLAQPWTASRQSGRQVG